MRQVLKVLRPVFEVVIPVPLVLMEVRQAE